LLVEGEDDRYFFTQFIKVYCQSLTVDVQVIVPKDIGGYYNNKQVAMGQLEVLSRSQSDSMRLGLVVDADKISDGNGCIKTIEQLNDKLANNRFGNAVKSSTNTGYFFQHDIHRCGVWIMPNNNDEGIVEDLLMQSVQDKLGQNLLQHAKNVVDNLPVPHNFKPHKLSKAYLATWLAWQKNPKETSNLFDVNEPLLDKNANGLKNLQSWFIELFG
jgi:hypothetical protein